MISLQRPTCTNPVTDLDAVRAELAQLRTRIDVLEAQLGDLPWIDRNMRAIIRETAAFFGTDVEELLSRRRRQNLSPARFAAAWTINKTLPVTFSQIGRAMGGRDHTTVINAVGRAEAMRRASAAYRMNTDLLAARVQRVEARA